MNTTELINIMLVESTGKAMCDSGGDNGRAWQRNQKNHPKDKPELTVESTDYITVNIAHYLPQVLEQDDLCEQFNSKFAKMTDWNCENAYGVSTDAEQWLIDNDLVIGRTWNTCNGESLLSQTLQGANVTLKGNESNFEYPDYVLLQIHQGADVRGGYTDAKLFKMVGDEFIDTMPQLEASHVDGKMRWSSENGGYNWGIDEGDTELTESLFKDCTVHAYTGNDILTGSVAK